ncbi:adenylate/guanylate cyclase domain-containing protein [Actinomadura atramentaria]|uniref:adenylate/guanylate cyclase domain-containing protein n=1 Tax=Actinomadura atramentaria TaxID=1990 RepID=UPI0003793215|nr:adenylate/guanylate cyclase domain-containing protein [Actinomadura atramentaria]
MNGRHTLAARHAARTAARREAGRAVARQIGARLEELPALPGLPRSLLELRVRWVLLVVVAVANLGGAAVVLSFALFVLPDPPLPDRGYARLVNTVAFFGYPLVAAPSVLATGLRMWRPVIRVVRDGAVTSRSQGRAVLLGPMRLTLLVGGMWTLGAIGWFGLDIVLFNVELAIKTGLTCLLGALATCTIVYLLSERLLRPAAALVLATGESRRIRLPGVVTRAMLAWALGTVIPVLGLICVGFGALFVPTISATQLSVTMVGLGATAILVGMGVTYMAIKAVADPIKTVRTGMARVERGDLDARIDVYDASEVGQLQAGFNHMVSGLRQHERLRDLFGRHVGEQVADLALESDGIELGGEVRNVAVLFVDLAGSTRLAETHSPDEVVELLNRFFGVVVGAVGAHGGWINKFEGDAALAVFGAPLDLDDAAGGALGAAREIGRRLRAEVPGVDFGVGVSAGEVVAGYIGAEQRFEYTVIGDPVNEGARLSDLAKTVPGRVLAAGHLLDLAHLAEAGAWEFGKSVTLRGRSRPTRLAMPLAAAPDEDEPSTSRRSRLRVPRPRVPRLRRRPADAEPTDPNPEHDSAPPTPAPPADPTPDTDQPAVAAPARPGDGPPAVAVTAQPGDAPPAVTAPAQPGDAPPAVALTAQPGDAPPAVAVSARPGDGPPAVAVSARPGDAPPVRADAEKAPDPNARPDAPDDERPDRAATAAPARTNPNAHRRTPASMNTVPPAATTNARASTNDNAEANAPQEATTCALEETDARLAADAAENHAEAHPDGKATADASTCGVSDGDASTCGVANGEPRADAGGQPNTRRRRRGATDTAADTSADTDPRAPGSPAPTDPDAGTAPESPAKSGARAAVRSRTSARRRGRPDADAGASAGSGMGAGEDSGAGASMGAGESSGADAGVDADAGENAGASAGGDAGVDVAADAGAEVGAEPRDEGSERVRVRWGRGGRRRGPRAGGPSGGRG